MRKKIANVGFLPLLVFFAFGRRFFLFFLMAILSKEIQISELAGLAGFTVAISIVITGAMYLWAIWHCAYKSRNSRR
jgi:hypothetical protein